MAPSHTDADMARAGARERQRIAHDLHDGLGQLLGGIALKAEALRETLAEKSLAEAGDAAELVTLLNEALAQTRLLVRGLDPVLAPEETLASILAQLAASTERLFPVTCTFAGDPSLTLPSADAGQQLFRVAQEAISNALRHGKATLIELELSADEDEVTLLISDNGVGFEQRVQPESGMGLRIMAHRCTSLGGAFEMTAGAERGSVARCRFPLAHAVAA